MVLAFGIILGKPQVSFGFWRSIVEFYTDSTPRMHLFLTFFSFLFFFFAAIYHKFCLGQKLEKVSSKCVVVKQKSSSVLASGSTKRQNAQREQPCDETSEVPRRSLSDDILSGPYRILPLRNR